MYKVQKKIELEAAVKNVLNSNPDESNLRNQIAKFIENDSVITGELNKLKSDLKESELLIDQAQTVEKAIKSELDRVLIENQKIKHDGMQLESQYEIKIQQYVDAIASLDSKYESKCNETKHLTQELNECKSILKDRYDKIQSSEQEIRKLKTILIDREREIAHVRSEMKEESQRSSFKIKNLVAVYQKEKDAILRQKHDLQLRLEEVERELDSSRSNLTNQKEEFKRSCAASLNDAVMKASIYEQRTLELEQALILEKNQSYVAKLHQERINQKDRYECEFSSNECSSLQHQVKCKDDTIHNLEQEVIKLRESTIAKDKEITKGKEKMEETEDQVEIMRNTMSSLSEDAKLSKMEAQSLKKQLNSLMEKSKKDERQWKQRLDCEVKRSKGYKERCLEAHAREKLKKWNALKENETLTDLSF
jgi:chromosome segregation ATPase